MKVLILISVLSFLISCKSTFQEKQENSTLKKAAEAFCSCRGGVLEASLYEYITIENNIFVRCFDGTSAWLENMVIACGKKIN